MVVKLIRIDGSNTGTIEIKENMVFGRREILFCKDKNISRTHVQLQILQNAVRVTALHLNPCFYKKTSMDGFNILMKGNSIDLAEDDVFGLLPRDYWYKVKFYREDNTELMNQVSVEAPFDNDETQPIVKIEQEECDSQEQNEQTGTSEENKQTNMSQENKQTGTTEENKQTNMSQENRQTGTSDKNNSTNKYLEKKLSENDSEENKEANMSQEKKQIDTSEENKQTIKQEGAEKRKLSQTEEVSDSGIPTKVKLTGDEAIASTSGVDMEDETDLADQSLPASAPDNTVAPVVPPQQIGRERCFYGTNCFRRNPSHKAQYSHPGDGDWGSGDLGECPFGAACTRHDPRHWTSHRHPPGTTPPSPGQRGSHILQRRGNTFYINAHTVNVYEDHFSAEDSDEDNVDNDYEF